MESLNFHKCESLVCAFTKYLDVFLLSEEHQDATGDAYDIANPSYQTTERSYYDVRPQVQTKI